jgi:hypothetical protein
MDPAMRTCSGAMRLSAKLHFHPSTEGGPPNCCTVTQRAGALRGRHRGKDSYRAIEACFTSNWLYCYIWTSDIDI